MSTAITMSSASSANIAILQLANEQFQITQKRVSTGKMIFGAADDATRYKMSEQQLGRSRQIGHINNNISLALKTLETTDKTLKSMISLIESAQNLVRKAQSEGSSGVRGIVSGANINSSTAVAGYAIGAVFSITSDSGQNFTYNLNRVGITWGDIVNALNSANIGVVAEFIPSTTAGQTNIRFSSSNGEDFTFDGASTQTVMDDLANASFTNIATGQSMTAAAQANNLFANAGAAALPTETGFRVSFGGAAIGTKNVTAATALTYTVAPGADILVFEDGNGQTRTLTYSGVTPVPFTVQNVINDINSMNAGVKAEVVNDGTGTNAKFVIRNTNGGDAKILTTAGFFAAAGTLGLAPTTGFATPLSSNNALRLQYGQQYDAIITNINLMVANNPVTAGRNLLQGQNLAVVMDEFAGNPVTVNGVNITAAGTLSMAQGGNTWTTDANIQTSATQSNSALTSLRIFQAQFATFNSYMKERFDLNKAYSSDLKAMGDELVAADTAEESANMVALQTRQQFAVQAFSMGSQTEQGLLRLLG